jgi:hypothetical protein
MAAAGVILAGLICCATFSLRVTAQQQPRCVVKILAIKVSEVYCSLGMHASATGKQPAIADQPQTAADACVLHACYGMESCQMRPIPELSFSPCEDGVMLVSMQELLQQSAAGQAQASSTDLEQQDLVDNAQHPETDSESSSYLTTSIDAPSVLQFAAECFASTASAADKTAHVSSMPIWSDTRTIEVSANDWNSTFTGAGSSGEFTKAPSYDGVQTNLAQQLLLVELTLPATPDFTAAASTASTANQQHDSQEAHEASADGSFDGQLSAHAAEHSTCVAGWQVWLARAGMAVFVGALQLVPFLRKA